MQKSISLLGSTGSIGTQCLAVCENLGCRPVALTAHRNVKLLAEQARRWTPRMVAIADEQLYSVLRVELADLPVRVMAGSEALCEAALACSDITVNAMVGIAGLRPTLSAVREGKTVALANKETLVAGGSLVIKAADQSGALILPVDSEHSAMLQCLQAGRRDQLSGVILTASGGPFFGMSAQELATVTVEQALKHPNWSMGCKISVDSATLMNKGLELIEAMWLFDLQPDQIEVLVHRQSVVHSAVEFLDGSVIAQLGVPDMRTAIQYAITYPDHLPAGGKRLSLADCGALTFERPDVETFRCLGVCVEAAQRGGYAPCVANGANEQAVALFLDGSIPFSAIGELVADTVAAVSQSGEITLEGVEEADRDARVHVLSKAAKYRKSVR